jgi:hypothetical protein
MGREAVIGDRDVDLDPLFHCPALLPATSRIAFRSGSNANSTRSSERPLDPGRSSFMFL